MARVAVVTGASKGLGAALASWLLAHGYAVGVCARSTPKIQGGLGRSVDVADAEGLRSFAEEVVFKLGRIDLWINNAGILGPVGPLRGTDQVLWDRTVAVNLIGVANGTRAFLGTRARPKAILVNIASRVAITPAAGLSAYSATKAAVVALSACVAKEEQDDGLDVHVVLPPSVSTDIQETLLSASEDDYPLVGKHQQRKILGQIISPEAVADRTLKAVLMQRNPPRIIDLTR